MGACISSDDGDGTKGFWPSARPAAFQYNASTDTVRICAVPPPRAAVCDSECITPSITFDLDAYGRVVAVDITEASDVLAHGRGILSPSHKSNPWPYALFFFFPTPFLFFPHPFFFFPHPLCFCIVAQA